MKIKTWNIEELTGYVPITTFYEDFSIADIYGVKAIKDTYKRAFKEWKTNYKYLTELVMALNWKAWEHRKTNVEYTKLYVDLYNKANEYAYKHLKEKELEYFIHTTD